MVELIFRMQKTRIQSNRRSVPWLEFTPRVTKVGASLCKRRMLLMNGSRGYSASSHLKLPNGISIYLGGSICIK